MSKDHNLKKLGDILNEVPYSRSLAASDCSYIKL